MEQVWDFKREFARKFVHFLSVFILLIYFIIADTFNKSTALIILVLILIISLEFEYFRLEFGERIPVFGKIWGYLRREKERGHIGGDIFFIIGCILALAVFNNKVAVAGILMTIFGDLSAALIGKRFGKHYLNFRKDKAWEGIFAEFFVDILVGVFVFFGISFIWDFSVLFNLGFWIIILSMALIATFVETIVAKIDDNLLIPIFSGFTGQVIFMIFEHLV